MTKKMETIKMLNKTNLKKLTAVADPSSPIAIFANRVDTTINASTEHYLVGSLSVNFGSTYSIFDVDKPETKAALELIENGSMWLDGTMLHAGTADRSNVFYRLDLSTLVPEGWVLNIVDGKHQLREIGFTIAHPDHVSDVAGAHILTNADLHAEGDEICGAAEPKGSILHSGSSCQRNKGHIGKHQVYTEKRSYDWDTATSSSPHIDFGFTCQCPHCGFVDAGPANGERACFTCQYWIHLANERQNSFVIDGEHYTQGNWGSGGFGGRVFKIKRHDGCFYEGELWGQGRIPEWMRERLPDNAEFVSREG